MLSPNRPGGEMGKERYRQRSDCRAIATAIGLATGILISVGSGSAHAESCALSGIASVALVKSSDHSWLAPVQINGVTAYMQIVPSAPRTLLFKPGADGITFERVPLETHGGTRIYNGNELSQAGRISLLALGAANTRNVDLPIAKLPEEDDQRAAGRLGLDFLGQFDVELDLKNRKLNLFSPQHCPGKVVYWSHDYSQLPITIDGAGHVLLAMALDGKPVTAMVNTLSNRTYMQFNVAKHIFGLTRATDGVVRTSEQTYGKFAEPLFTYPFHSLAAGDLSVQNPKIYLLGDVRDPVCNGKVQVVGSTNMLFQCTPDIDVSLGTNVLAALRLYFAFGEKTVYFTGAAPAPIMAGSSE